MTLSLALGTNDPAVLRRVLESPAGLGAALDGPLGLPRDVSRHILRLTAAPTRLYVGAGFCERLLPPPHLVAELVGIAGDHDLAPTLLLPPLTDRGIRKAERLFPMLDGAPDPEVVVSDWGALDLVANHHRSLRPVLGRLLVPTLRDPRVVHRLATCPDAPHRVLDGLRSTNLFNPDLADFLRRRGVERVETDVGVDGDVLDLTATGFVGSCHLGWSVAATGRICHIGAHDAAAPNRFGVGRCAARCREVFLEHAPSIRVPGRRIDAGNASLFQPPPAALARAIPAARGVDRLVLALGAPHGARERPAPARRRALTPRRPRSRPVSATTIPAIQAPVGSADEVPMLVGSGATELYTGFVPSEWTHRFTDAVWINRRGPASGNLRTVAELEAVCHSAHEAGATLSVTLNAPHHAGERLDLAVETAATAREVGVDALIVADPGLLLTLHRRGIDLETRLSSVAATHSIAAARLAARPIRDGGLGVSRVVLPRHVTVDEVTDMVRAVPEIAFEVFGMNDQCPFEEGHCFTQHHLGGLPVLCQDRGRSAPRRLDTGERLDDPGWDAHLDDRHAWLDACASFAGTLSGSGVPRSTCGLCALPAFARAGVRAVKIVGREAAAYRKLRSVQLVRRILDRIEEGRPADVIAAEARELRGSPELCASGRACYYHDVLAHPVDAGPRA